MNLIENKDTAFWNNKTEQQTAAIFYLQNQCFIVFEQVFKMPEIETLQNNYCSLGR